MQFFAEQIRQLFFTHTGVTLLQVHEGGHREWSASMDEAAFVFVTQHQLKVTLQSPHSQRSDNIAGGEFMLVPAGCSCMLQSETGQTAEALLIRFAVQGSDEALDMLHGLDREYLTYEHIRSFRMPQARHWIQDFTRESAPDDHAHHCRLQSHLYMIVSGFIQSTNKPKAAAADLHNYVEHAREYILKRYHETVDIEELARASGVSSSRFYRAFRLHTGVSPLQYATSVRLNAAMRLLAGGASSVTETAHAVGYPDEYYFSRLFKKQLGLSPSEYLAAASRRIVSLSSVLLGDLEVLGIRPQLTFSRYALEQPEEVFRQLRQADPDLLLSGPVSAEIQAELEEIAPATVIRWKGYSWKQRLMDIAGLLELTSVAERWLDQYHTKIRNARSQMLKYWGDEPVLLAVAKEQNFAVFGHSNRKLNDLFYDELGLSRPEFLDSLDEMGLYSLQEIADVDCRNILIMVPSGLEQLELARLEQNWRRFDPTGSKKRCLFIPYYGVLNYNPACYENLIEQAVWHVRSRLAVR
jgi:AraC-like DNA-binding protein